MLQEEKDRNKITLLSSKKDELMLLLENTQVMRVKDFAATELIENEYEKYLHMFPVVPVNKSHSIVNVKRSPNKSRTNNTLSTVISSSSVFTPKKSKVTKPNTSRTVTSKSLMSMSRNSASKNTDLASLTTPRYDEGNSHDPSSREHSGL